MRASLWGVGLAALAVGASALPLPQKINFQGKLVDPSTNGPRNGSVSMTFKIYPAASGGTAAYTETQTVSVVNGVFSVQIGTATGLTEDLFTNASAYLGVTVSPDAEMTPRQQLVMNAYAFTAEQLAQDGDIRINPGPTAYSTFTAAGNLLLAAGISASTGNFTAGVTATSGTFTQTGSSSFSLTTSSGINMSAGTLDLTGSSGMDATGTGVVLSTLDFVGATADPAPNAGFMYYNSSTGSLKVSDGSGQWNYLFGQSLGRQYLATTDNAAAIAVNKPSAAAVLLVPLYLPGPMMVNHMIVDVTTALGAAGDIGLYDESGGLVLNSGASSLTTTAGVKNLAPAQTGNARFLAPGQYYAAVTFNSTTGRLAGNTSVAGLINRLGSVVGGGTTLPASITPTAVTAGTIQFFFSINP